MEESRWPGSAEEYRAIQALVRSSRHEEALERAERAVTAGQLGRKHAARLHSLICWLYTEGLHRTCPTAALHGEEAVRLAELVKDEWIRCEALTRLVHAYCQMGDLGRARAACSAIAEQVEINDAVIPGGAVSLLQLEALVAGAAGDENGCLALLERAEGMAGKAEPSAVARVRVQKVGALLEHGRYAEARRILKQSPRGSGSNADSLDWEIARAWLAVEDAQPELCRPLLDEVLQRARSSGNQPAAAQIAALQAIVADREGSAEGRHLARQALQRAIAAGRHDLVTRFRRRLAHLL